MCEKFGYPVRVERSDYLEDEKRLFRNALIECGLVSDFFATSGFNCMGIAEESCRTLGEYTSTTVLIYMILTMTLSTRK